MSANETIKRIKDLGIIPAIRTAHQSDAVKSAEAILAGGISVMEISLAPKNALDVLNAVATAHGKSMLIGAGAVVDGEGARQAALAGARFIVTPGFNAEAVAEAKEFGLAILAGALSPTEVQLAQASGADAVKLFPCFAAAGPRYLKALCAQYPAIDFIASGGVTLENCVEYIRAGARAIGVGRALVDSDSLAAGDYCVFTVRAKRLVEAVKGVRNFLKNSTFHAQE